MNIVCEARYKEAMDHAEKTGDKTFQDCLDRLKSWEENKEQEVTLYYDSSPLSFYFELKNKDRNLIMNGGVLYHGSPDKSFAVQLVPAIGWKIHT